MLAREVLTRYGRHNIGFLWLFVEPMLFIAAIAWLWSLVKIKALPGISVPAFALTGYSSVLLWRNAATRATQAVSTNWALLYHRAVTPMDLYLARMALEVIAATGSLLILGGMFTLTGVMLPPADPYKVAAAWLLLAAFAIGFGCLVGALAAMSDVFERIWHMLTYLLFPVSGAMFMVHWLAPAARDAVLWLPMVHGVEMLRSGWFGPAVVTYESPGYLLGASMLSFACGGWLVRRAGRRAEPH